MGEQMEVPLISPNYLVASQMIQMKFVPNMKLRKIVKVLQNRITEHVQPK